ncbi:MAG: lmo0937 family membrane protein [Sphingobacteriales bacterium]|nr:lmo0937 family membrane protein [Sphingobacteriales bacterium]
MGSFLYTIAVVLVILWAIGYFCSTVGAIIHLLMIAIIAVLLRVIQGK